MNSLRLRLILVLAAVVATAMGVVFLYVVPTLRDNLIAGRLKPLQQVAHTEQDRNSTLAREIARLAARRAAAEHPPTVRRIGQPRQRPRRRLSAARRTRSWTLASTAWRA